jgi:hypothetical protein
MSSSQSSQFPPKSIVKNSKSSEGVETLRQITSTSPYLDNEYKSNGQTIPTIKEPDEGTHYSPIHFYYNFYSEYKLNNLTSFIYRTTD